MSSLSTEHIRLLAEAERKMDSGEQPYVMLGSHRVSVSRETMDDLGLHPKQTINDTIFRAILEYNIASVQAAIAIKKASARAKAGYRQK